MAHRGPRVVRRAKELTWGSPMMAAVVAGAFLVSLLCCYVYAYARVTSAGFEASRLRRALADARQKEEVLRAELSGLRLASGVAQRAQRLGLIPLVPGEAEVIPTEEEAGRTAASVAQSEE